MFSKACEHGIKAIIYIAVQSINNRRVKIGEIAENAGSPEPFTAKVLGQLSRHGILNSLTGPYGGFYMDADKLEDIKLIQIVEAIDGDSIFSGCGLGLETCNAKQPCPVHDRFVIVRSELKKMLMGTSVLDLALGFKDGKTTLIR